MLGNRGLSFGTGVDRRAFELATQRESIATDFTLLGADAVITDTGNGIVIIDTGRRRVAFADTRR